MVDAGGVPVCRVRQYVNSCHMYIVTTCTLLIISLVKPIPCSKLSATSCFTLEQ